MTDIELISTDELSDELMRRHDDCIIIASLVEEPQAIKVMAKTKPEEEGRQGFELEDALNLLHDASLHLINICLRSRRNNV